MRYIAIFVLTYGISLAADWPNWRGPAHTGISAEPVPKRDFSKIAWRAKIGVGFSSMAVADGRVFAMGCSGQRQGNQRPFIAWMPLRVNPSGATHIRRPWLITFMKAAPARRLPSMENESMV